LLLQFYWREVVVLVFGAGVHLNLCGDGFANDGLAVVHGEGLRLVVASQLLRATLKCLGRGVREGKLMMCNALVLNRLNHTLHLPVVRHLHQAKMCDLVLCCIGHALDRVLKHHQVPSGGSSSLMRGSSSRAHDLGLRIVGDECILRKVVFSVSN